MKYLFIFLCCVSTASVAQLGSVYKTKAKQAILMDASTGTVIFSKDSEKAMVPSSMSKIMTIYLTFTALKREFVTLDEVFTISTRAWKQSGSRMFLEPKSRVSVENLIKGVIVPSGNDAALALAEGLSGSEESFVNEMNVYAKKWELKSTHFKNSTGWPQKGHTSSARDLAFIAKKTMEDFPELYQKFYGLKEFTHNHIRQHNRNGLLWRFEGADGLKTGTTDEGGYGLVASAKRGETRLIMVINGLESSKQRNQEAAKLLRWGFSRYETKVLWEKGENLGSLNIVGGKEDQVTAVAARSLLLTTAKGQRALEVQNVTLTKRSAPILKGEQIGTIHLVSKVDQHIEEVPLLAANHVEENGFIKAFFSKLFSGPENSITEMEKSFLSTLSHKVNLSH